MGSTAQEYGVQGYPTIKYFAPGSSEPEEYDGGRTADAIVKWAEEKFAENIPPPEVVEAVSNEVVVDVGGFGYPAMVVLSHKKMKYSTLTGSFSYDGLNEFLRDLSYGKGRTTPVRGASLPKLPTIDAWDGKDGQLPVEEEEYDLSDVELDDKDEL